MMTRDELMQTPSDKLVAYHNALAPEAPPLKFPWKKARLELIARVENAQDAADEEAIAEATRQVFGAEADAPQCEAAEEPGSGPVVEETAPRDEIDSVKPIGETVALSVEDKARLPLPGKTIRETALRLLTWVHYYEDRSKAYGPDNRVEQGNPKAGSVGLTYLDIISLIKEAFPDANTSVACLRWYAVKVRAEEKGYEGWTLTRRRPRLIPPRPAKADPAQGLAA